MPNNSSVFQIPSFARSKEYIFEPEKQPFNLYEELNKIAEEIEECRLRNC